MGRFLTFRTLVAVFIFFLIIIPSFVSIVDASSSAENDLDRSCSTSPQLSNPLRIESHLMTACEVEEKKATIGVRDPNKEYDLLVEGHGTGLAPPTGEEWSTMVGNVSVVESVSSDTLQYAQSFDLSSQSTFPKVGNQGNQGSCAAWAVTYYSYGYQEATDNGWTEASSGSKSQLLSPAWTYNRVSTGAGSGSSMTENGLILIDWGVPSMEAMPYKENDWISWGNDVAFRQAPFHRASELNDINYNSANPLETIDIVKNLVQSGIPVNFAIWADSSWYYFGDGNYILSSTEYHPTDSPNHAQTIVGWNDSMSDDGEVGAFKIVNSWGTGWGDHGYYWLTYDAFKNIGEQLELTFIRDKPDYSPSLLAVWQFNDAPSKDAGFSIDLGTGSNKESKDPYYYANSGSYPTFMCLDVTEFANRYSAGMHDFHLSIGSGTQNGVLSSFKLEKYDSAYVSGRAAHDSGPSPSGVMSTPCSVSVTLNEYPSLELGEAVDAASLILQTEGTATWVPVDNAYSLGPYCAQSGDIADQRSTWMNLTVSGPGTIAFQWRVSSESGSDLLSFQVDGITQENISGETAWARSSFELGTGIHQLSWVFSRDGAGSSGADCGWVDQMVWIPPTSETSFRINSNSELITAAAANGWLGNGSSANPIAISNVTIDAQGKGSCLYIGNTTLHVTVINCNLFNASFSSITYDDGSSLILFNVQNVSLQDNEFTQSDIGVSIINSSRVSAINNSNSYNSEGMVLISSDLEVKMNRFVSNAQYGLEIVSGMGSIVQGNIFKYNYGSGMVFDLTHVQASDLGRNDWSGTYGNLWSDWVSPDIDHDGIVDNPYPIDGGLASDLRPLTSLLTPPHDLIGAYSSNALRLNWQAPYFTAGDEVLQYNIYKTVGNITSVINMQATSSAYVDNQFSQGSTYTYFMTALTALGESSPSNSISIHVPDNTPPIITITSPTEGSFFKIGSVEVAWRGWDGEAGVDHYELQTDSGAWINVGLDTSRTLNGLSQGSHLVAVKAVDKEGNSNSDEVGITIDSIPPTIQVVSPQEASVWNSTMHLEFRVIDQNPDSSTANISGYYLASGGNMDVNTDLALPDGVYSLIIQATDMAGNSISVAVSFTVDTSIPQVKITSGQNGTTFAHNETDVIWNGNDGYLLDHFEISLDGAAFSSVSDACSYHLAGLIDGSHTFTVKAVDFGGNTACDIISFIVDTEPPRIVAFGPYGGNISIDSVVTVSFTSDLDLDSVIILVYQQERLAGEILHDGTTFRFLPDFSLQYGTNYTVQVWAKDAAANELNFSWEFSTQNLGSISGQVKDLQGNGVFNATVMLDGSEFTTTAADGSFNIRASPGSHTILVVKEGYENLTKNVVVYPGEETELGPLAFSATSEDQSATWLIILATAVCLVGIAAFALWRVQKK